jgi:hypothetical protein
MLPYINFKINNKLLMDQWSTYRQIKQTSKLLYYIPICFPIYYVFPFYNNYCTLTNFFSLIPIYDTNVYNPFFFYTVNKNLSHL